MTTDILVHRMNTLKVNSKDINDLRKDLKSLKGRIKHYPFRKVGDYYEIEFCPKSKLAFLLVKYDMRFGKNET